MKTNLSNDEVFGERLNIKLDDVVVIASESLQDDKDSESKRPENEIDFVAANSKGVIHGINKGTDSQGDIESRSES